MLKGRAMVLGHPVYTRRNEDIELPTECLPTLCRRRARSTDIVFASTVRGGVSILERY